MLHNNITFVPTYFHDMLAVSDEASNIPQLVSFSSKLPSIDSDPPIKSQSAYYTYRHRPWLPPTQLLSTSNSSLRSLKASWSPEAVHAHHWYVSDPGDGGGSRLGPRPSLTALGQPLGSHTSQRSMALYVASRSTQWQNTARSDLGRTYD